MKLNISHDNRAAFEHARLLTAHFSKSFYISAKMLPKERRWATYALYGFCRYADNLIDNPRNRTQAELLAEADFIADELNIAYRTGESEHPILKPFMVVAKQHGIPKQYALDLLEGVKMDIQTSRYATFDDLYLFAYRVAGVVGIMMTYVLGYKTDKAFLYAEDLGVAMQLTNILRDIQEDKEINRIYIPQDEMRQYGVTEEDIFSNNMTPNLHKLIKFQVKRAHTYYEEAESGIKLLLPESRFSIYSASKIYQGILHKIEAQAYNPFMGRVFVPQIRKIGILIREILRSRVETVQEQIFPSYYQVAGE